MSAAPLRQPRVTPQRRPADASRPEGPRRHLRAVPTPEVARSLAPFAAACLGIIVAALSAVLLINTAMAEGAYERRDLKIEIAQLHKDGAVLLETLEANAAPEGLAKRAARLGMGPASSLGFVSLSDGIVLETGK